MDRQQPINSVVGNLAAAKLLRYRPALALEADIERNYISLLELGTNSASTKTLFKIAPALGVSVSVMLGKVEERLNSRTTSKRSRG